MLLQWIPISSLHNDIYLEAADGNTVLYIHALWLLKAWNSAVPCYISSHLYPHRSPCTQACSAEAFSSTSTYAQWKSQKRDDIPSRSPFNSMDSCAVKHILTRVPFLSTSTKNLMVPIESHSSISPSNSTSTSTQKSITSSAYQGYTVQRRDAYCAFFLSQGLAPSTKVILFWPHKTLFVRIPTLLRPE
jgi:hypothetical protein